MTPETKNFKYVNAYPRITRNDIKVLEQDLFNDREYKQLMKYHNKQIEKAERLKEIIQDKELKMMMDKEMEPHKRRLRELEQKYKMRQLK